MYTKLATRANGQSFAVWSQLTMSGGLTAAYIQTLGMLITSYHRIPTGMNRNPRRDDVAHRGGLPVSRVSMHVILQP